MSGQGLVVAALTLLAAGHFLRDALRAFRPARSAAGKPCGGCASGGCAGLTSPLGRA